MTAPMIVLDDLPTGPCAFERVECTPETWITVQIPEQLLTPYIAARPIWQIYLAELAVPDPADVGCLDQSWYQSDALKFRIHDSGVILSEKWWMSASLNRGFTMRRGKITIDIRVLLPGWWTLRIVPTGSPDVPEPEAVPHWPDATGWHLPIVVWADDLSPIRERSDLHGAASPSEDPH